MAWNFRQEVEREDNPEIDFHVNLNLEPLRQQVSSSASLYLVYDNLPYFFSQNQNRSKVT